MIKKIKKWIEYFRKKKEEAKFEEIKNKTLTPKCFYERNI
jgi:hypothetical protein